MITPKEFMEKVTMVSDAEAETADFLVCMPASCASQFGDDFYGHCVECGVKVRYRWHAPRKPKRICVECAVKAAERGKV